MFWVLVCGKITHRTDIPANLTDPHIRSPAHFVASLLTILLLTHLLICSFITFLLILLSPPHSPSPSPFALLLALSVQIRSCPALGNQISPPPCQPSSFTPPPLPSLSHTRTHTHAAQTVVKRRVEYVLSMELGSNSFLFFFIKSILRPLSVLGVSLMSTVQK